MSKQRTDYALTGYVFIFLGLAFAVLGYLSGIIPDVWLEWRLSHQGQSTQGVVLSRRTQRTQTTISYFVTYQFSPQSPSAPSQPMTVEERVNPDMYHATLEGNSVVVWYVLDDPQASTLERQDNALAGLGLWLLATFGSFVIAAVLLRKSSLSALLIVTGIFLIVYGFVGVFMILTGNTTSFQKSFNLVSVLSEAVGSLWVGSCVAIVVGICLVIIGSFFRRKDTR